MGEAGRRVARLGSLADLLRLCRRPSASAEEPYLTCRDVTFGLDVHASSYRVQLDGDVHVVVVGDGELSSQARSMFETVCRDGQSEELPDEVAGILLKRRVAQKARRDSSEATI